MSDRRLPLLLKGLYTAVVVVVVPSYWVLHGPANYLWLSDTAMILMVPALWWEHRLLASMMAVGVLPLELCWTLGFGLGLLLGQDPLGLAAYMFDPQEPLYPRILSGTFHVALVVVLVWSVARLGYDRRAPWRQTPLTWLLLLASWAVGDAEANQNFVHGFGHDEPWRPVPQPWYLLGLLALIPLVIYLPTHLVLGRLAGRQGCGRADRAARGG